MVLRTLLAALALGAATTAFAEGKMKVFILAGQSNMDGRADIKDLPAELKTSPANVRIFRVGKWVEVTPLAEAKQFGPEFAFAHAIGKALPKETVGIVKFALGGTSLDMWGAPGYDKKDCLYQRMMALVKAALATGNVEVAGVLWMQGESDAEKKELGEAYAANFAGLIARLRQDLNAPNLPFLFGQIQVPTRGFDYKDAVLKAQADTAVKVHDTAFVSTDGLPQKPDHLHFNAEGQTGLGARFAEAWVKLVKKK